MKITDAKVFVCSPGRNFVTLKIYTDDGVYGLGDATLNGRELAVRSYLVDHVLPCLIGRDPSEIEDIWQYLYRGAYWRKGPVTMTAIAAVDMALWDIKGKALHTPLYNLLGGRCRSGVMAYCHANGRDLAETIDEVGRYIDLKYLAVRAQSGIPGLAHTYGVSTGRPILRARRKGPSGRTSLVVGEIPAAHAQAFRGRARPVRRRCAPAPRLSSSSHADPGRRGWARRSSRITCSGWKIRRRPRLQEGFRLIRQHTTTPIAVGEIFDTSGTHASSSAEQLIDYLRMTVLRGGGITPMKKIAAFADMYHVQTGCHGATDLSPITMGAALHFDLSIPNFGVQEHMPHSSETDAVFPHAYRFESGYLHPGDAPGHGVDFDEALAARFPYERAYLPVNRKLDGTLWNW